jgi:hypothetical protein
VSHQACLKVKALCRRRAPITGTGGGMGRFHVRGPRVGVPSRRRSAIVR